MHRFLLLVCLFVTSCTPVHQPPKTQPAGQATVVWISIDGLRGDYVGRLHPPTLQRLADQGAFSTKVAPIFPSLTFPNHIAQVTGGGVDRHGVMGNSFFDTTTNKYYNFPDDASLIRTEPIWTTATRQGVRTAVIDWPMSHKQTGPYAAAYFGQGFDSKETDEERLSRVLVVLNNDKDPTPLRLVMTYVSAVDSTGHKFGPDSPELAQSFQKLDGSLGTFLTGVRDWFTRTHGAGDTLYVLITTDHGMEPVHTQVNLDRLVGSDALAGARIVGGGPTGNVFLAPEHKHQAAEVVAKLRTYPYISAWLMKDVPARFHYADPSRTGDLLVLLAPGYNFTANRAAATMPATASQRATHGYDVAACPNMLGGAIVWKLGSESGGRDLGALDNTQWHATVAKLLGIEPAKGADLRAIDVR